MTDRERFEQIERLYHLALEREPSQRSGFLKAACSDDQGLSQEVESLLVREEQAEKFMEGSALEMAAHGIADSEVPSLVGRRLGPYDVQGRLGAGGMGEVYRARDTRLNRTVAIKVLPSSLARDPERRKRFEREAQAVSSLNHPHICALYDVGQQDGVDFLVMEYFEGETLAARLKKGALPLATVLTYGIEIAAALDQAHRHGVTHRDLKPGNIMLTRAGTKVLDFGLARVGAGLKPAPGEALPLTEEGAILGTLQYMAPEQLEGKGADARTDIFAFGAVVYEMATSKKAFEGDNRASVMAAILERDPPPLRTLDPRTPATLDREVQKCLAKDPDRRWQSAQDLKDELQWIAEGSHPSGTLSLPARGKRAGHRAIWIYAALATLTILLLALGYLRRPVAEGGQVRVSISSPEKTTFRPGDWGSLSPDGNLLAFVASAPGGPRMLWVRRLDSPAAQPIPGTEGARRPFWSPDSRFIGFGAQGKLKKIEVGASRPGSPQVLCDADDFRGGAWNQDGVILFSPHFLDVLYRVPATGGGRTPVTALDPARQELGHFALQFLPDGRHFLYITGSARYEDHGVFVGSLDSPPASKNKKLLATPWMALYAPPGYLLFWRGAKLVAQRFDPDKHQISGEPVAVAEQAGIVESVEQSNRLFSVSTNGLLAYQSSEDAFSSDLVWLDRTGKRLGTVARGDIEHFFSLSPDQKRLAFARSESGGTPDIWLSDLSRGTATRFTSDLGREVFPVWSPDGSKIIFSSNRGGQFDLYEKASSGLGREVPVLVSKEDKIANHWSHDGRFLVYADIRVRTRNDLWILPVSKGTPGDRKPIPFVQTEFDEHTAAFSPDGRWIAYCSDESGSQEAYVQSFSGAASGPAVNAGGKWLVSLSGGCLPRWRRDGKELYYLARDGKLMAVEVKAGATFETGTPRTLFDQAVGGYDVAADGQRFLVRLPVEVY